MKLIKEYIDYSALELIKEGVEGTKNYFLKGPMLQANVKNRNGRVYMRETLIREVDEFVKNKIKMGRALGELDHPPEPTINLDRVSHMFTDLSMDGDTGIGVAKIMPTPKGQVVTNLIDGGAQLGMSTRGVGTLDGSKVADDYKLITIDIVADPSAPNAFVEGVMEGVDWMISESGDIIDSSNAKEVKTDIDTIVKEHVYDKQEMSALALDRLQTFINQIK